MVFTTLRFLRWRAIVGKHIYKGATFFKGNTLFVRACIYEFALEPNVHKQNCSLSWSAFILFFRHCYIFLTQTLHNNDNQRAKAHSIEQSMFLATNSASRGGLFIPHTS